MAGVVFFVGSFPLLWFCEGCTQETTQMIAGSEELLDSLSAKEIAKKREKLISERDAEIGELSRLDELLKQNATIEAMRDRISQDRRSNAIQNWLLRGAVLALMCLGIFIIADPFAKVIDRIPILCSLRKRGAIQFAVIVGLVLTTLTVSAHWSFANPFTFLGIVALVVLAWYAKSRYLSKAKPETGLEQ